MIAKTDHGRKHGRPLLAKAMDQLFKDGRIDVEAYGRTGDPRKRLVIVQTKGED